MGFSTRFGFVGEAHEIPDDVEVHALALDDLYAARWRITEAKTDAGDQRSKRST